MTPAVNKILAHWRDNRRVWQAVDLRARVPDSMLIANAMNQKTELAKATFAWWEREQDNYPFTVMSVCLYLLLHDCDYLLDLPTAAVRLLAKCGDPHAPYILPIAKIMYGDDDGSDGTSAEGARPEAV